MPGKPLKTFQTHIGFFDAIVAAPSQKAALAAWGSKLNLFAQGLASATSDPRAIKASTAKPGVVLRRAAGSDDDYAENPALPHVFGRRPKRIEKTEKKQPAAKEKKTPVARAEPDRGTLDAAERALSDLDEQKAKARAEFVKRRALLTAEEQNALRGFETQRRRLSDAVAAAKRACEQARHKSRR